MPKLKKGDLTVDTTVAAEVVRLKAQGFTVVEEPKDKPRAAAPAVKTTKK